MAVVLRENFLKGEAVKIKRDEWVIGKLEYFWDKKNV